MTGQEARDDEREPTGRLIEYVTNVLQDRKYGHDIEWVRMNLHPNHLRTLAAGYRKHPEPEITEAVRSHWRVIRGAQTDMLNGRPDMDALEEIALASAALDQLLGASGPWVPAGEGEQT